MRRFDSDPRLQNLHSQNPHKQRVFFCVTKGNYQTVLILCYGSFEVGQEGHRDSKHFNLRPTRGELQIQRG
jgi:hypothetical protein